MLRYPPIALLALLLSVANAWGETAALSEDGSLLQVQMGSYGSLFPGSGRYPAENQVLALDITTVGGATVRHLVPDTEGTEVEAFPTLVRDGGQTFILWSSQVDRQSTLLLVGFDGDGWTQSIEVSGDSSPVKGPPKIRLTRDVYEDDGVVATRLVAHIVWWEEVNSGVRVLYTPIVFFDGTYLGWNPVLSLADVDNHPDAPEPLGNEALFRAPSVLQGTSESSVIVALPQQRSDRLMTLRIAMQPVALLELADDARSRLLSVGAASPDGGTILSLADDIRMHIVGVGRSAPAPRLFRGIRDYIGSEVYVSMLAAGSSYDADEDLQSLGDLVWRTVISSGASILGHGLSAEVPPCGLLHLGRTPSAAELSRHQIEICLVSDRAAPETKADMPHTILTSADGTDLLVAWVDENGTISYRRSVGDGWTGVRATAKRPELSTEQGLQLLRHQLRIN